MANTYKVSISLYTIFLVSVPSRLPTNPYKKHDTNKQFFVVVVAGREQILVYDPCLIQKNGIEKNKPTPHSSARTCSITRTKKKAFCTDQGPTVQLSGGNRPAPSAANAQATASLRRFCLTPSTSREYTRCPCRFSFSSPRQKTHTGSLTHGHGTLAVGGGRPRDAADAGLPRGKPQHR